MKKIALIFVSVAIVLLIFLFASDRIISFLSFTSRTDANLLVVEGWLPEYAIDEAYYEFKSGDYDLIITTGLITSDVEFFNMYSNGFLVFYPGTILPADSVRKKHLIEITAHSKQGGNYGSHFKFFVNDSLITDFKADEKVREYRLYWEGALINIDSLLVNFDNDYVDEKGDINLYVKEITIDGKYFIPYQFHTEFDMGVNDGKNRERNNYNSNAEIVRNMFINKGIDSNRVVAVTAGKTVINRTLSSVTEFRDWIRGYKGNVSGINIISLGTHSRRTWMTYKMILGKDEKIGVISIRDIREEFSGIEIYFYVLKEFLDFLYYKFILIFY